MQGQTPEYEVLALTTEATGSVLRALDALRKLNAINEQKATTLRQERKATRTR